ncbi:MAG: pyruvate kinase [Fimbriimonadaceae bacterium]
MKRRTKIVCTLGPSVDSRAKIRELIEAGMNVARLNCSHGDWETRRKWVAWIRELSPDASPVAILADLQGPKFRIGDIPVGSLQVWKGQMITIGAGKGATIPILQKEILKATSPNARLLLGDGNVELRVGALIKKSTWQAKVVSAGTVKSRQGLTLVGKIFDAPALTEKDHEDIREACAAEVDFIALSYVRGPDDMIELRKEVAHFDPKIRLCAKIETREAIKNLSGIIAASDMIMVARGDMGLQMDVEDVPLAQKAIISACNRAAVPVITATQMLESMITNARPTRAEVTDVANAVLDGTDAVMLSGETAAGEYPIEAVRMMAKVAENAEPMIDHERILERDCAPAALLHRTEAVAHSAVRLADSTTPRAILTTTTSGQTTRLVSMFRPRVPILCATWDARTLRQMAVVWGVDAILVPPPTTTDEIVAHAFEGFVKKKRLKPGDLVIITAGVPAGIPGHTNLILMEVVKT